MSIGTNVHFHTEVVVFPVWKFPLPLPNFQGNFQEIWGNFSNIQCSQLESQVEIPRFLYAAVGAFRRCKRRTPRSVERTFRTSQRLALSLSTFQWQGGAALHFKHSAN